jgi:uncharacterized protein (DUF1810 family)
MNNRLTTLTNNDLDRFMSAQQDDYEIALSEIKKGKKYSHLDMVYFSANSRFGIQFYCSILRNKRY